MQPDHTPSAAKRYPLGRLQFWLQGHPNKRRPWAAVWVGNRISDLRYWAWRLAGGSWDD